jgi:hypothetical protein
MAEAPCTPFPKVTIPSIPLPFGAELKALSDFSQGPPSNCALVHSLMLQLMPTLAGLTCFFKLLNVIAKLEDLLGGTPPLSPTKIPPVLDAMGKLAPCFGFMAGIPLMIKHILLLIIAYLRCFIQAIESIVNFKAGIDLNAAEGNPVLLASLSCADDNAQVSMEQIMEALQCIEPLMKMIEPLAEMADLKLELPSLGDMAGSKDPTKTLEDMNQFLGKLEDAVDKIPG